MQPISFVEEAMERIILRLAINAVAMYLAIGTGWIAGIESEATVWWAYLILGVIFGLVNALVRPLLNLLTCPLILLTLGLFTLVINAVMFWLTGIIGQAIDLGFTVNGAWPAFLGGLLVSVVNAVLTMVFREELRSP
jgi:putative membrane protein